MQTHSPAAIDAACLLLSDAQRHAQRSSDVVADLGCLLEAIARLSEDARLASALARAGCALADNYDGAPFLGTAALESALLDLRAIAQEISHE